MVYHRRGFLQIKMATGVGFRDGLQNNLSNVMCNYLDIDGT